MADEIGKRPTELAAQSFEYRLQRTPVGIVLLGADRRIRSVNPVAMRLLAPPGVALEGRDILSLHPAEAREKVSFLLEHASLSEDGTATLMVTTAMGSLVAKVSRMETAPGAPPDGFVMIIHSLANAPVMGRVPAADDQILVVESLPIASDAVLCPLLKLPLVRGKGDVISLIEVSEVMFLVAQGHYAEARTLQFSAFCPRSLVDLEQRLDPALFVRVHRRYLVNIRHVRAAGRESGNWHLVMADPSETRLPVSRAKVKDIRRRLGV